MAAALLEIGALFAFGVLLCLPALGAKLPRSLRRQPGLRPQPSSAARFESLCAGVATADRVASGPSTPPPPCDHGGDWPGEAISALPLGEALVQGHAVNTGAAQECTAPMPAAGDDDRDFGPGTVLLVDARDKFRTRMLLDLARTGHRVFPVTRARDAVDVFTREPADLIQIHRDALCEAGRDFVRRIRAVSPDVVILVHGGGKGAGKQIGPYRHGVDILVVAHAGDDTMSLAALADCALAAARSVRMLRRVQETSGRALADLCHHLRSSLDVIAGYVDMIDDRAGPACGRDLLDGVRASAGEATLHMQGCAGVALDMRESVRLERVELSALSERIRRLVARQCGDAPLQLSTSGPMQGSALFTDGEKLLAILSSVASDALRTAAGHAIQLTVRSQSDRTEFVISDAGHRVHAESLATQQSAPPPGPSPGLAIAEHLSQSIGATLTGERNRLGIAFVVSVPGRLMTQGRAATVRHLH